MKSYTLITSSLLLAAGFTSANPIKRDTNSTSINATQVLQFALTLEHLENTFYTQALAKYTQADFERAGYASWVRGRFEQISEHEASHVALLTKTLGKDAVAACNYSFPYSDPTSFAALSGMLESVGNAAYIGAAKYLVSDPASLQVAASILSMEGRHASWVKSAVFHAQPWSSSYDTPLDGNLVYTLAAGFIKSCPDSNPKLPFTAFPNLTIASVETKSKTPNPGDKVKLTYENSTMAGDKPQYLAFFHGLNTTFAKINSSEAFIPKSLQGLVFAVVTTNDSAVSDDSIVAGPAPLTFNFGANVPNY